MTDNEIIKALECCYNERENCLACPYKDATIADDEVYCDEIVVKDALDLIKRQHANIERLKKYDKERDIILHSRLTEKARAEAIKEFAEKVDELLKRYSHLHKYAEDARRTEEEYADGTPMEMVSVWEVLSLKKWEMCDYETMNTLQHNIEVIEKARLLSEIEHDFELLKKEMVGKEI